MPVVKGPIMGRHLNVLRGNHHWKNKEFRKETTEQQTVENEAGWRGSSGGRCWVVLWHCRRAILNCYKYIWGNVD